MKRMSGGAPPGLSIPGNTFWETQTYGNPKGRKEEERFSSLRASWGDREIVEKPQLLLKISGHKVTYMTLVLFHWWEQDTRLCLDTRSAGKCSLCQMATFHFDLPTVGQGTERLHDWVGDRKLEESGYAISHNRVPRAAIGNYFPFLLACQGVSVSLTQFCHAGKQPQILSGLVFVCAQGLFVCVCIIYIHMLISTGLHVAFIPGPRLLSERLLACSWRKREHGRTIQYLFKLLLGGTCLLTCPYTYILNTWVYIT